jgi:hypothetical protein
MDKAEALAVAEAALCDLRSVSYNVLVERFLDQPQTHEVVGASGVTYQVELQAFWDRGVGGDLRVSANVDDGGWRAFRPLTTDFIIASDGSFVGED